jgi:hypothetical protein
MKSAIWGHSQVESVPIAIPHLAHCTTVALKVEFFSPTKAASNSSLPHPEHFVGLGILALLCVR